MRVARSLYETTAKPATVGFAAPRTYPPTGLGAARAGDGQRVAHPDMGVQVVRPCRTYTDKLTGSHN
ncbi:hypothetical protein M2280_000994 [Prescottella agglutinans]|uniref:Uncharacterized protein n=1 Tax=Prescottella agglutinans TaxID=1644129 RepID=A0ABT6M778_9NOCA|nr:hypothetical protein [Prescottella agglutinans]